MNILVTGGCGYIGSVLAKRLVEKGHNVFILDKSPAANVPGKFYGDLADLIFLDKVFKNRKIDFVMHLAAYIEVGESMKEPMKYYHNNYCNTLNLVYTMLNNNVKNIIYASSAAVYGQPEVSPITEDSKKEPINHYGKTKLMSEELLQACTVYGLNSVALRFFNAAGSGYNFKESHNPETHLVPILLKAALDKKTFVVNGNDFATKDGTCIRDFVHVLDIAEAHVMAMENIKPGFTAYNIGSGVGYSLLEVIQAAKEITCKDIDVKFGPKRKGDPAVLVASNEKIKSELGWQPKHGLKSIVHSALGSMI